MTVRIANTTGNVAEGETFLAPRRRFLTARLPLYWRYRGLGR